MRSQMLKVALSSWIAFLAGCSQWNYQDPISSEHLLYSVDDRAPKSAKGSRSPTKSAKKEDVRQDASESLFGDPVPDAAPPAKYLPPDDGASPD